MKKQDIASYYTVLEPGEDFPASIQDLYSEDWGHDFLPMFREGKEWTLAFMEHKQPRTWKCLMEAGPLLLAVKESNLGLLSHVFLEVEGQVIEIRRRRRNNNPDDPGYQDWIDRIEASNLRAWGYPRKVTEYHLSLPEPIRMAYYHRIDGMNIPDDKAFGAFTRILPRPISANWESVDLFLSTLRLKKKYLPLVEEMIPGIRPEKKNDPYTKFKMFLSSHGSFKREKPTDGDDLFVKNHIQDGVVYYIRDADVPNMTILADPAEAIDRYCEHVLLRKEGRFDFRPWAVPFESPSAPE